MNKTEKPTARKNNAGTSGEAKLELRLYIAGQSARSIAALNNLEQLCETHLKGRCRIEVIDLLMNPQLSREDQIIAVPTLVRKPPGPIPKIIGDLSNSNRVLAGLGLLPEPLAG